MNADLYLSDLNQTELRISSYEIKKQRGRLDCIFIYSFYLFVILPRLQQYCYNTPDVIKGQWINFQDNGSKDRKDTEEKVVILHHKAWYYCEKFLLLSFIFS